MGAIVLGSVAGVLLPARTTAEHPLETRFGFPGFQIPVAIVFGLAGTVILRRRPGNVIGALLLAEGVLSIIEFLVEWVPRVLVDGGAEANRVTWTSVIANVIWVPSVAVFGPLFALYPDGEPVSRRWARAIPAVLIGAVALTAIRLVTAGAGPDHPRDAPPGGRIHADPQSP